MKRISSVLMAAVFLAACSSQPQPVSETRPATAATATPAPVKQSQLAYLKEFNGKYSNQVEFWGTQPLNERLKKLLGNQYQTYTQTMQVVGPVTADGDVVFVTGNNKVTGNGAIFLADTSNDVINAKLFLDKAKKIEEFAEPGQPVRQPQDVQTTLFNWKDAMK